MSQTLKFFSNTTIKSLALALGSEPSFKSVSLSSSIGNLTLEVSSYSPYALLPMNAKARYTVDILLQGWVFIIFYIDYMNNTGVLNATSVEHDVGPPYVYEGLLAWSPNVIGSHKIIAGVVNGSTQELLKAINHGTGLIATDEVYIDIQRCPSNIVLDYPEAIYGDTLPITVAVSKPRPYKPLSNDFYSAVTLAPQLSYGGAEYVIDEGIDSTLVRLYINGTLESANLTDASGLIHFSSKLNFTSVNLTAVVDSPLLSEGSAERVVSFSKIRVYDRPASGSGLFKLNHTISNLDEVGNLNMGGESSLGVEASLLNQSVWNAPISITIAQLVSSFETDLSGVAYIPSGSDYLRVHNTTVLRGDVNRDGQVDIADLTSVGKAYGSRPGHPNWNVDADINHSNMVDIADLTIVASNFGRRADYVAFDTGEKAYLDSQGFAGIPVDATSLTYYKNGHAAEAYIEFFQRALERTSWSNNLGRVMEAWVPTEPGSYLAQVKLPTVFDVSLAVETEITGLDASTNLVEYFEVVKRPIELSVEYQPSNATFDDNITMVADVFDAGLGIPAEGLTVEFYLVDAYNATEIYMGSAYTNSSGTATFLWNPMEYLDLYPYLSALFVLIVKVPETSGTQMKWVRVVVDARYSTYLELLSSEVVNVDAGVRYWGLHVVRLVDFNGSPVPGRRIILYRDGVQSSWANTNESGIARWDPLYENEGIYHFTAIFEGSVIDWYHKRSNEVRFVVNVEVTPVSVLFDVQPRKFKAGTTIPLKAQVFNASSASPLEGFTVGFYGVLADGSQFHLRNEVTNSSGIATASHTYDRSLGVYSFLVNVSYAKVVVVSPVTLTVTNNSYLWLGIAKGENSYEYVLSGMLLSVFGVPNKQIKIFVNDTLKDVVTTTGLLGQFNTTLNLEPEDNKPATYNVKAVFEGDDAQNVTSYLYTPNGTRYAVCTTLHFGYEPSTNYVTVRVEPTTTLVTTASNMTVEGDQINIAPPKTPEQIQAEAESSGWLTIWHEFTWWYPWYRMHIVSVFNGEDVLDVGLAPLGYDAIIPYPIFGSWINDFIGALVKPIVIGYVTAEIAVLAAMQFGPQAFAITFIASTLVKAATLALAYNSIEKLKSVFIGAWVSLILGAVGVVKMLHSELVSLAFGFITTASEVHFWKFLWKFIYIPVNMAFLMLTLNRITELGGI